MSIAVILGSAFDEPSMIGLAFEPIELDGRLDRESMVRALRSGADLKVCPEITKRISWFRRRFSSSLVGHRARLCSTPPSLIRNDCPAELHLVISGQTLMGAAARTFLAQAELVSFGNHIYR